MHRQKQSPPEKPLQTQQPGKGEKEPVDSGDREKKLIRVVLATFVVAALCVVFAIFCFDYLVSLESVGPEKKVEQTGQIVVSVASSLLGAALTTLLAYIIRMIWR